MAWMGMLGEPGFLRKDLCHVVRMRLNEEGFVSEYRSMRAGT